MFGLDLEEGLGRVRSINRILEKLLVDLVRVRGRAADYEVVHLGQRKWIVHRKLLNQLASTEPILARSLYVVGVAEQSLFWKDIRRVLFSGARFRVLCRTAQGALQPSWSPVKLVHVLKSVAPDLADQLEALGSVALVAMVSNREPKGSAEREQQLMRETLVAYAKSFAAHYGQSIATQELAEVGLLTEQPFLPSESLEKKREAFEPITKYLRDCFDLPQEPNIAAQYRGAALMEAGFLLSQQAISPLSSDDVRTFTHSQECFLDSEFVAIYW